jgi:hypothetical protein
MKPSSAPGNDAPDVRLTVAPFSHEHLGKSESGRQQRRGIALVEIHHDRLVRRAA